MGWLHLHLTHARTHPPTSARPPARPPGPCLQDAALRAKVDERRREAQLRKEFEAQAAVAERERQWRIARGQATAEDLAGPVATGPAGREAWMTDLPPERQAPAGPTMPAVRRPGGGEAA